MMKQLISCCCLVLLLHTVDAQTLTIAHCYELARENYPLTRQHDLIAKSRRYTIENIATGYLPQININGQATYQSEVTQIPVKIPGIDIPGMDKDQYKLYGDVSQVLYDGGVIRQQKKLQQISSEVEEQSLEVELYKLKDRINQLFFGILMIDEQVKQAEITRKDMENMLKKTEALVANGTALKSNADVLKAELIQTDQRVIELRAMRKSYAAMLGLFISSNIDENTELVKPSLPSAAVEINRPELSLYNKQIALFAEQKKMVTAKNIPRIGLFAQGGIGKPALNMLSNTFEGYYLGGVRLNWSLSGWYTAKKEKLLLGIKQNNTDLQRQAFLFNTGMIVKQQQTEEEKWQSLLNTDNEIITLRENIKKAAAAQLENGVITGSDYIREANAEAQAKQSRILHEIQLLLSGYNLKWTTNQ
ncbi:MAG: transporter [Sphingobacteriales bacterium 44-15]|nr:MAG: transporter [Sphingobacteriales bacterium 44-15]